MSSQDEARNAAGVIIAGRLAALPDYLIPAKEYRALAPVDLRRLSLTKLEWRQAAQIHLLVAEDAVTRSEPSAVGKPWTGRFAHSMVLHLTASAKDTQIGVHQETALLAAAYELQRMLNATAGRGIRQLLALRGAHDGNLDWVLALGITQTQFQQALESLSSFHKIASSRVRYSPAAVRWLPPSPDHGTYAATSPASSGSALKHAGSAGLVQATNSSHALRPSWLTLAPPNASVEHAYTPAWRMPGDQATASGERAASLEQLTETLARAWDSFAADDISAADDALHELYESAGELWRPAAGADGHLLWNWLRFIRLTRSAIESGGESRRLAAVSAVELLVRNNYGLTHPAAMLEQLIEVALAGLPPVLEPPLSRAFASYSGRLLSAIGHEELFETLEYSNADRASARAVWAQEFPQLGLTPKNSSADFARAISKSYREYRYRAMQQSENYHLSDQFLDLLKRSFELLDTAERELTNEALVLLTDTMTQANSQSRIDVPEVRQLKDALRDLAQDVATSGSALLQDTVFFALRGALAALESRLSLASRVSHPELVAELVSAKLPLSAKSDLPFTVRFRIRNAGNSTARDLWAQADADNLALTAPDQLPSELSPAAEEEVSFQAISASARRSTAQLTLRLTWIDDLGQDFETETLFLAEDQRRSQWTPTDANPYTLSSISDPDRLVGRTAELASLEGILRMTDSTYVTGLKRVGKSSLVHTLLNRLRGEGWAISMLALGDMLGGSSSPASIALGVIDGISEALMDAGIQVPPIEISETMLAGYAREAGKWLRLLERTVPDLNSKHVVVAIDDLDGIPADFVDGEKGLGLFLFLRSLVDKRWLSLVFIGSEVLPSVVAGQGFQLNQVRRTPLDHFSSSEDTAQLLRDPSSERLEWSQESIELIHQMVNGNPYYATMIAQRVWDALRRRDRTIVETTDILDAMSYVASNQDPFHFSHMWGDDPSGMAPKSRRAMLSAAVLLSAARCAPTTSSSTRTEEVLSIAQRIAGEVTIEELTTVLQRLVSRQILNAHADSASVSIRVPLLAEWLRARGRSELEAEFDQFARRDGSRRAIAARDYVDLASKLHYAGRLVNEKQLEAWIDQFGEGPRDRHLAFLLLRRLVKEGYFSNERITRSVLPSLKEAIRIQAPGLLTGKQNYVTNAIIVNHGPAGSSGPAVVTGLRQVLRVKKDNCVSIKDVPERMTKMTNPIIIVADDFAGTGRQLASITEELCRELDQVGDWRDSATLVLGAGLAGDTSMWTSEQFGGADIRIAVGQRITDRLRAFSESADIFESADDRNRAHDLIKVIGQGLVPNNPFGWGGQGLVVLLESNCPNNTLPIFWKEGRYDGGPWQPLFPRAT